MIMQVLLPKTVQVSLFAVGHHGIAQAALALIPNAPLSASLAAVVPTTAIAPYLPARPGIPPSVSLVRDDTVIPLDTEVSAEVQGVREGDTLSLIYPAEVDNSASYDQIMKTIMVLLVKQGRFEEAQKNLSNAAEHERHFKQRDWALRFILWLFTFLVGISVALIAADGFRVGNFQLNAFVRNSLAGAVLAEVATLAAVAFRFVFSVGSPGGATIEEQGRH